MKPLQLWIPAFNTYNLYDSEFRKDLERAMKQWRGEERIWLHPKFKKTTSWVRESTNIVETAIPSKTFNLFTVVHVSEDGYLYPPAGPGIPTEWEGKLPNNLLNQWLKTESPIPITPKIDHNISVPIPMNDKVIYVEIPFYFSPGPVVPITDVDENSGKISTRWPPEELKHLETISIESESKDLFGPYIWESISAEVPIERL